MTAAGAIHLHEDELRGFALGGLTRRLTLIGVSLEAARPAPRGLRRDAPRA
jgi:hypothetical protein